MRKNEYLFWIIFVTSVVHHFWIARDLPEVVASHFGQNGLANGYSSKQGHLYAMMVLYALMALSFGILPVLFRWIPTRLINLPHREYWLAPERREASLGRLRDWMAMMGVSVFFFFMVVNWMVVEANRRNPPRLSDSFLWALAIFIGFTLLWTVALMMAFRKPPPTGPASSRSTGRP
ncbi:MAG: DUF1648 domain-containing protein [Bdellovibrionales bacterium]|nr:DUF1648 domain-containing protein [Bdellovibrionales bacterium]